MVEGHPGANPDGLHVPTPNRCSATGRDSLTMLITSREKSTGHQPESTPNHQGTIWHDPIRAGAIDAFNRLLDSRERCDVPSTIRAIRDLKKCGFRVGLLRPMGEGVAR